MSVMEQDSAGAPARASLVNDPKVRGLFYQALLIAALVFFGYFIVTNTVANLERQNIASGWGFVENTAGFGIIQSLVPYAETSTYGQAIFVGFLNTLMVAVVGICPSEYNLFEIKLFFLINSKSCWVLRPW